MQKQLVCACYTLISFKVNSSKSHVNILLFWSNTECSRNHMFCYYELDLFVLIKIFISIFCINIYINVLYQYLYQCFVSIFVSIFCINIYINVLYQYLYRWNNLVAIMWEVKQNGPINICIDISYQYFVLTFYINILYQYFLSIFVSGGNNVRGEAKWTNQEKHLSREKTKRSNLCKNCKKERKTSKVYLSLSKKWK